MTHPVPAAVDATLALLRAAPAYEGVRVDDGLPVENLEASASITIAQTVEDPRGATGTSTPRMAGDVEVYDIGGVLQAWSGDIDLAAVRARVYALFDALTALLRAHPDLDGAVLRARLARHTYRPAAGKDTVAALIEFVIQIEAIRFHDQEV